MPTKLKTALPHTVLTLLNKAGAAIARAEQAAFECRLIAQLKQRSITSPIEQMLYLALSTVSDLSHAVHRPLLIMPQQEIGDYRIDFEVIESPASRGVLVECDSQAFHERTEHERRYEKARDRFLQQQGYCVLHYTGKEIIERPFWIASEIIGCASSQKPENVYVFYENYANA